MARLRADIALALGMAVLGLSLTAAGAVIKSRRNVSGSFDDLLGLAACAAGILLLLWWVISLALAFAAGVLSRRSGNRINSRVHTIASAAAPEYMKRIAVAVLGFNLIAVPAATASEHTSTGSSVSASYTMDNSTVAPEWMETGQASPPDAQAAPELTPQWKPTRQLVDGGLLVKQQRTASVEYQQDVTVKPGDCLWSLAAAQLGPTATDLQIAQQWQRWYAENRETIGADPDVLLPGTVLTAPSTPQS